MRGLTILTLALAAGAGAVLAAPANSSAPDFSSGDKAWVRTGIPFLDPDSGKILGADAKYGFATRGVNGAGEDTNGQVNVPDWQNPNFKPWVAEKMKAFADEAMKNVIRITPQASCYPGGTPGQMIFNEPMFVLQTAREVTLLYQRDHFVRHVYMNVDHSKNPKPSWFGESVGHYEGDELVVDTIGFNDKADLDNWGLPHSDAMHVVERFKMAEGGKGLRVTFTIDDPKAFNKPWSGVAVFRQVKGPLIEAVCAENNFDFAEGRMYPIPQAARADF